MNYELIVDPLALRHCLTADLPFREEVPALKTLNTYTNYVPPAYYFKLLTISIGYRRCPSALIKHRCLLT
jgi:hypothetical protein